jgi:hypothetical protein
MTGFPGFNYPAFDAAAANLRDAGFEIVSPAEQDTPEERAHLLKAVRGSHDEFIPGRKYSDFLAHDVKLICDQVDGIVFMPGWQKSSGARLEAFVALMCKKEHFYLYDRELRVTPDYIRDILRRCLP